VDGHTYTDAELTTLSNQLTDFMFSLVTAYDSLPGGVGLGVKGGNGGAATLAKQPFYFGINDTLQGDLTVTESGEVKPKGAPFNPIVFTLYDGWHDDRDETHASIERGRRPARLGDHLAGRLDYQRSDSAVERILQLMSQRAECRQSLDAAAHQHRHF
jgi:hypothetical protein